MLGHQHWNSFSHLASSDSLNNFRQLQRKWPNWKLSDSEHKCLDLSECRFIGQGRHEIVVFTFARHQRLSRLSGASIFPAWASIGPHWSDNWHDGNGVPYEDVPLIGIVRGVSDAAGLVEPFRILAVVSCTNGRFVYDEIMKQLPEHSNDKPSSSPFSGNPRSRRLRSSVVAFLSAAADVLSRPCPPIPPIAPRDDCRVSITLDQCVQAAQEWQDFVEAQCKLIGNGSHLVYAYTYHALAEAASLTGETLYPVKVGWTPSLFDALPPAQSAIARVSQQIPFPEPAQILGLLLCTGGRKVEAQLHAKLKDRKIRCIGKEWFLSNRKEIQELMGTYIT